MTSALSKSLHSTGAHVTAAAGVLWPLQGRGLEYTYVYTHLTPDPTPSCPPLTFTPLPTHTHIRKHPTSLSTFMHCPAPYRRSYSWGGQQRLHHHCFCQWSMQNSSGGTLSCQQRMVRDCTTHFTGPNLLERLGRKKSFKSCIQLFQFFLQKSQLLTAHC